MKFFKWITGNFGTMSDKRGWQNTAPIAQAIDNAIAYSPELAMQVSTVWACVDLLSRTVASLPCRVYKDDGVGRVLDTQCNLHDILARSPNYGMTPFEFVQTLVIHWALRGNAYALITRFTKQDKKVKAIYPLNPDQMQVYRDDNGILTYHYNTLKDTYVDYSAEDIIHWKGPGNGILGMSKLDYMKASVTEAVSSQETAVDIYKKHGKPSGILTSDAKITNQQQLELAKQFGVLKDGGIPVLNANLHFQQLSLTPAETQLLETRKFGVEEICRWFGVPSALVNNDGGTPGSNLEVVTANFYKSTILPMCISLEQAIMKRLPCIAERYDHSVQFELSFLNRANDASRATINAQALQNGWKTRNEVRREEGLAPMDDADALTAQTNLTPLRNLGQANPSQVSQSALTTEPTRQ